MKTPAPWILVGVLVWTLWAVPSASAHALLVRSTPAANAVLQQPPVQVEIVFSEPLEAQVSSIQVFDANSVRVDAGDIRIDPANPARMTVSLHALSDGVYTVTWKALSSVDGHQTTGTFPFAVGEASAPALSGTSQSTTFRLPFSTLLAKFLMLASLALLLGRLLFTVLVWNPATASSITPVDKPSVWDLLHRLGRIGILVSIGLGMLAQAGQATGSEMALPWNPELGRILSETRLGVIWLARLALAMLAVWLAGRGESALRSWSEFAVYLGLLWTVTLTSHAATEARPLLPMIADWLHLLGMTFWLGGIVYFFTAIRHIRQLDVTLHTGIASRLAGQFSINALLFVGITGITGFYSAFLRVGSWQGLQTSLYGHVLLIKQAWVLGLLSIAAINLFVIAPHLKREHTQGSGNRSLVTRFGRLLLADMILAGLLLGSVSFLTYIPPARITTPVTDLQSIQRVEDLKLDLSISPGRVGQNTFVLRLSSGGEPVYSAKEVLLRFTPGQANFPPSEMELIGQGDGTFQAKGSYLSAPGTWQVQAVVRRQDKFDTFANFNFTLPTAGSVNRSSAASKQAGILLVGVGMLWAALSFTTVARPALRYMTGIPLFFLFVGLGLFLLTRPPEENKERANPIPPNAESIAAGQALFVAKCAPCHGTTGKGDGPIGMALNPRPADLRQHAIPGVHTDAQLFEWITNGFPGSQMPAFKATLSDTDRWNLVNFIRTLAP